MKTLFPSLPPAPGLGDVLAAFPANSGLVLQLADQVLNAPSDFTVGERELLAAYVSGLNACAFCTGAHTFIARAHGMPPELVDAMLGDLATAPVDDRLRPVLAYVGKLTQAPAKMTEADAQAVYDAGWSEAALYDAVQVCALFNYMNRIVEGTGVAPYPIEPAAATPEQLEARRGMTYADFGRSIGVLETQEGR